MRDLHDPLRPKQAPTVTAAIETLGRKVKGHCGYYSLTRMREICSYGSAGVPVGNRRRYPEVSDKDTKIAVVRQA